MSVWIVKGPCLIKAARGSEINGYEMPEPAEVLVPVGRSVFYKSTTPPEAGGCSVSEAPANAYETYKSIAAEVAEQANRILLVGPSDSGKTSLASFIAAALGSATYITADVGQNEVYSPGFAASVRVNGPLIPGSVGGEPERCFVGAFSPQRAVSRYVRCTALLASGKRIIVDTDGWVTPWEGLDSKTALAVAVRADIIVSLGLNERMRSYLEAETGLHVVAHEALAGGVVKSREERRIHRERLIAKRLQGAKKYAVNPEAVPVFGSPLFRGNPLPPEEASLVAQALGGVRILYAEKTDSEVIIVAYGRTRARVPGVRLLRPGWAEGLVACAVCNGIPHLALVLGVTYKPLKLRIASHCMPRRLVLGVDRVRAEGYGFS